MQAAWLPAVMEVQAQAYAGLPVLEPIEFFANRQQLAPEGCQLVLEGGQVAGYLVSYPWDDGLPPALGATLEALPPTRRHWFIHDCAVNPRWQGRGVARRLLQAVERTARRQRVSSLRLVSLAGANGYWQRQGFKPVQPACTTEARRLREKLSGYGEGACLMQRPVSQPAVPVPSALD